LHDAYGSPTHGNKSDPLDELVFIVLSQMTTHQSFNRVFDRLKARVPGWEQVMTMRQRTLQALIKDAGLSRQKAPRIQALIRRVVGDFGRADLSTLRDMSSRAAEKYLCSLPGVGLCRHRRAWVPDPPASPGSRDPPGGAQTVLRLDGAAAARA
jgi:endonuclease III